MTVGSDLLTVLLAAVSLSGAAGYVVASWRSVRSAAVLSKIAASTAFVALALVNGATATAYGRAILAALVLSWIGDVLLLSRESPVFLAGIGSFLAAHIAFSIAFMLTPISLLALSIAFAVTALGAALILKWLWAYLRRPYTFAVPIYVGAVMVMLSLAVATTIALPPTVCVAGLAFTLSDISVARDRFVDRSVLNKAWGLPLYYLAQVLFAASTAIG